MKACLTPSEQYTFHFLASCGEVKEKVPRLADIGGSVLGKGEVRYLADVGVLERACGLSRRRAGEALVGEEDDM